MDQRRTGVGPSIASGSHAAVETAQLIAHRAEEQQQAQSCWQTTTQTNPAFNANFSACSTRLGRRRNRFSVPLRSTQSGAEIRRRRCAW